MQWCMASLYNGITKKSKTYLKKAPVFSWQISVVRFFPIFFDQENTGFIFPVSGICRFRG